MVKLNLAELQRVHYAISTIIHYFADWETGPELTDYHDAVRELRELGIDAHPFQTREN